MGRINILDKHVAELIAAGEVVERPSSVIKELVENAIDAGATAVTVEIKNGGVSFMRVSDNGSGILREDVRPAFIRHATSKVTDEDDLLSIATLGFRGEALASISSVSHLELITKAPEEAVGTHYLIEGGEEISLEDAGCPDGTTFIIRDLFYNTPARMKFLKTDMAEGNAVSNVVDKIALSHPEIALTYIKDGKQTLRTSGDGKLLSAIYAVYGRDFARGLIPVDYTLGGIRVSGYISPPENARPNRNMQNFFINRRFVISKTAMAAISEACKGVVMVGKFPACVLFIDMSCSAVDVNVHPTKLEVRFVNERPVFDAVFHAVKTALMVGEKRVEVDPSGKVTGRVNPFELAKKAFRERDEHWVEPKSSRSDDDPFSLLDKEDGKPVIRTAPIVAQNTPTDPFELYSRQAVRREQHKERFIDEQRAASAERALCEQLADAHSVADPAPTPADPRPLIELSEDAYRYIGEAFRTYVIVEKNDSELLLIDKHAAHERIIYEKLKTDKGAGYSQLLLTPVTVTLNKIDYNSVLENKEVLRSAGFDVESFGEGVIVVRSAPQYLSLDDIEPSVTEMAGYLSENRRQVLSEKMEWIYHNVACRSAIKGGNKSTDRELIELAKRVEGEDIRHCPHGRPVCVVLKKRELERWFGRV